MSDSPLLLCWDSLTLRATGKAISIPIPSTGKDFAIPISVLFLDLNILLDLYREIESFDVSISLTVSLLNETPIKLREGKYL